MKRRIITLLVTVTLLAGMATIITSASGLPEEATDLGQMTWLNGDTQMGWRGINNAAREYEADPLYDSRNTITLTEGQIFKATHLVLELAAAPEGDLQIIWQSDYDAWGWNQSQIPLDDLLLMMDGNILTIPLPYYVENYDVFVSIATRSINFDNNGNVYYDFLDDNEITWEGKFLIGYYSDTVADLGITSAKLTYNPVGAPVNQSTEPEPESDLYYMDTEDDGYYADDPEPAPAPPPVLLWESPAGDELIMPERGVPTWAVIAAVVVAVIIVSSVAG